MEIQNNIIDLLRITFFTSFLCIFISIFLSKKLHIFINLFFFYISIFISFLIARVPLIFSYQNYSNPDEGAYFLLSKKMADGLSGISKIDLGTNGFLNSIVFSLPLLLDLKITTYTSKLIATIIIFIFIFYVVKTIFLITNKNNFLGMSISFITVLFFSSINDAFHMGYISTNLGMLIIVYVFYYIYKNLMKNRLSFFGNFNIGIFLSLTIFSKLQLAPISFIMGLYKLYNDFRNERYLSITSTIFGVFFLISLIISVHIYYNELNNFYISYILNNIYRRDLLPTPPLIDTIRFLIRPDIILILAFLTFISVIVILKKRTFSFFLKKEFSFIIVIFAISIFATIFPKTNFAHYHLIYIPFSIYLAAYLMKSSQLINLRSSDKKSLDTLKLIFFNPVYLFLTFTLILFLTFNFKKIIPFHIKSFDKNYSYFLENEDRLFDVLTTDVNPYMYVWGWTPSLNLDSSFSTISRRGTFEQEASKSRPFYNHFVELLLNSVENKTPAIIIDSNIITGPGFSFTQDWEMPKKLKKIISSKYIQLNKNYDSICPIVYLRNDQFDLLKIKQPDNLQFYEKNEIIKKLHDYNLSDLCNDMPYEAKTNSNDMFLVAKFRKDYIRSVYFLSSKKSASPFDIKINSIFKLDNKTIHYSDNVTLKPYPYWTKVYFKKPILAEEINFYFESLSPTRNGIEEILINKVILKNDK